MAEPQPNRPVVFYDDRCAFCRRWVRRWRSVATDNLGFEPSDSWQDRSPPIAPAALATSIHLVEARDTIHRGAAAVFRALHLAGRSRWMWLAYQHVPGVAPLTESAYALIARHRDLADRADRLLIGRTTTLSSYRLSNQIFLRLLGLIYCFAFVSLWVQIDGLIGSRGILPVHPYLRMAAAQLGSQRFQFLPTLCWLADSDAMLHGLCAAGTAGGIAMILGLLQLPAAIAAWACYLSLTVVGQDFLSFQWDALLLEAGFLAIFLAAWRPWTGIGLRQRAPEPSRVILWLVRWLLFRLMFMSGVVKLTSGDVAWHAWRAMQYHYETQPLPTWTAWWMFQLPNWFQRLSCGVVFLAELVLPILIFTPRRPRMLAFWGIVIFQGLIAATGNFGFFNLLTATLCCLLLDDASWRSLLHLPAAISIPPARWRWPAWLTLPLAAALLAVTIPIFIGAFGVSVNPPWPVPQLSSVAEPMRMANSYGLFAIMTTRRPEIIIEGSNDGGATWRPYAFRYKPGDVHRRPRFTTPHMPRLDWQMWFAALGEPQDNPWIAPFMARLMQPSPTVLALLSDNPFPHHPPTLIRAMLYEYHFTDRHQRRTTGAWWTRRPIGVYAQLSAGDAKLLLQ